MIQRQTALDCIVIGHNELNAEERVEAMEPFKDYSGGFGDVVRNYAKLDGRWTSFAGLFRHASERVHGSPLEFDAWGATNLAACYLTNYLSKRGLRVEMVNSFRGDRDRLLQLLDTGAKAAAITTTYYVVDDELNDVIALLRERSPETKIIVGGPFVYRNVAKSPNPAARMKQLGADVYIVENQGEHTLAALLKALAEDSEPDLRGIPNLLYLDDAGQLVKTDEIHEDNSLEDEVIDWSAYNPDFIRPLTLMRTARSCAFSCSFCTYPVFGGALVTSDLSAVERELKQLDAMGVRYIDFVDDTFNVPLPRFKKLCKMIIENKFSFKWLSFLRIGNMDDEAIDLAAQSGCVGALLGIESADNQVLKNMNKNATVEKYARGVKMLNERGIMTQAMFIVGFPGDTEQTVQQAIDFVRETKPTFSMVQLWYYDTMAPIAERAEEFGLEGFGFSWKHNTMDWTTADRLTDHFVKNLSDSTFLPGYGFGFENIFYLMGLGYDIDAIKGFLKVSHGMMLRSIDPSQGPVTELEPALVESVRACGPPPTTLGVSSAPATSRIETADQA